METLFTEPPIMSAQFFNEAGQEVASVLLEEDEGIGWTILVETADGNSILSYVDWDLLHEDPKRYAVERYTEAKNMVDQLLGFGGRAYTVKEVGEREEEGKLPVLADHQRRSNVDVLRENACMAVHEEVQ